MNLERLSTCLTSSCTAESTRVAYVTFEPGRDHPGMHESLVTYGGNAAPEVITCSHEEVAAAMAEGYYVATESSGHPGSQYRRPAAREQGDYEAWLNSVPMIVIGGTGPQDSTHRRPWIDWITRPKSRPDRQRTM